MTPERWQAALDQAQSDGRLPSIVGGVLRRGALVWTGTAGDDADIEHQYRIGSITKTMTAVLVMRCREEGLLSLDDPLGRHVPEAGYRDATLREMLSHTSGMQAEPVGPWWERSPGVDMSELLAANDGTGQVLLPGTAFHYSNLGFALLAEVVARLRGRDWWSMVRGELLGPLGMQHTSYDAIPGAHADGFSVDHFSGRLCREPHADTRAMAPAGQLWSTVGDLALWLDFLATGHLDVLPAMTIREMAESTPFPDYGLGLRRLDADGVALIGHTGSMPGFLATAFVNPETRDGVIALCNATTGVGTDQLALDLVAGKGPGDPQRWTPSSAVPDEVTDLLGLWFWGNTAHEMRWSNQLLELRTLSPAVLADRFVVEPDRIRGVEGYLLGETLQVHRGAGGGVTHLECATFVFTRRPTM
jgi:CubicO group peptidase (beta-lactamase class C family)